MDGNTPFTILGEGEGGEEEEKIYKLHKQCSKLV